MKNITFIILWLSCTYTFSTTQLIKWRPILGSTDANSILNYSAGGRTDSVKSTDTIAVDSMANDWVLTADLVCARVYSQSTFAGTINTNGHNLITYKTFNFNHAGPLTVSDTLRVDSNTQVYLGISLGTFTGLNGTLKFNGHKDTIYWGKNITASPFKNIMFPGHLGDSTWFSYIAGVNMLAYHQFILDSGVITTIVGQLYKGEK